MKKIRRKWRRFSLYKKSMIITISVFIILGFVFLGYVYKSMILYERNLIDNYIAYISTNGTLTKNINDNDVTISKYETNKNIKDALRKFYKSDDVTIKKNIKESTEDVYVYDLYNQDKLISKVSLKCVNKYKRMAILTISEWNVVDYTNYLKDGIYSYTIKIPSNYKLYINNELVEDSYIENDIEGLEKLTQYIEIDKQKTYTIDKLVTKPSIKILDENGNNVNYKIEKNVININSEFTKLNDINELSNYLKEDVDILNIAEQYSLFMSNDLTGELHGFYNIAPFLIKDSYMYEMAYKYSRSIDITFVSNHRLKNPAFANETVSNIIVYNENAFSAEVYLEKNMIVSGKDLVDKMHDRLYFVYYDGAYKLVNMAAVTEG